MGLSFFSTILFIQLEENSPITSEHLNFIKDFTHETAENTSFRFFEALSLWDIIALAATAISVYYAVKTYLSQSNTEQNTKKLTNEAQKNLLEELIKHLYRNMVITYTMKTKLEKANFDAYPSEEHFIKLTIPLENIHVDVFYGNDIEFKNINDLYIAFRNFNLEIDVIINHFRNPNVDIQTKERDIKTLLFKNGLLASNIIKTLNEIWPIEDKDFYPLKAVSLIEEKINKDSDDSIKDFYNKAEIDNYKPYDNKDDMFIKSIFKGDPEKFFSWFNKDVIIETYKENNSGGEKIHLIKY
ncbi:MAG: hypothetical protein Q4F97_03770 [Bacteroidales bacterium]|nr:hypothetical protein [Bacteroidales bacterium]